MALDKDRDDVGYQLGRYLAMIYKIQRRASPGINRSVADRFFIGMMTHPKNNFAAVRGYVQSLFGKSTFRGHKDTYERLLQEIAVKLDNVPAALSTDQQALFALGFDHEMSYYGSRKPREEATEDTEEMEEPACSA